MVRCPACKTVFSPADSPPPEEEPDEQEEEAEEEEPKAKKRKPQREDEDEEDEQPRKKKKGKGKDEDDEKEKGKNRDFDPIPEEEDRKQRRKNRRKQADDQLSPEEKAERRAAFGRAATGVKLIWISFALFMFSMVLILLFYFQSVVIEPIPYFITLAGVIGLINWVLAAIGVGLCLSGPRSPGFWGYGISAAVAVAIHLLFILVLVVQGKETSIGQTTDEVGGSTENARWGLIPTRLDVTMFYLTAICYHNEQGATPKGPMTISMVCGVIEMLRTVIIMMLMSCLARAALDEELAYKCTRAAGVASFGPGLLALLILAFIATMIETGAGMNLFTLILFVALNMGVYAIIIGTIFPAFMALREVADACDEPFQSLIPQL
jgi:hypothetical protein